MKLKTILLSAFIATGLNKQILCHEYKIKTTTEPKHRIYMSKKTWENSILGLGIFIPASLVIPPIITAIYSPRINLQTICIVFAGWVISWKLFDNACKHIDLNAPVNHQYLFYRAKMYDLENTVNPNNKLLNLAIEAKNNQKDFFKKIKLLYISSRYQFSDMFDDYKKLYDHCYDIWETFHNICKQQNPEDIMDTKYAFKLDPNFKSPEEYLKIIKAHLDNILNVLELLRNNLEIKEQL